MLENTEVCGWLLSGTGSYAGGLKRYVDGYSQAGRELCVDR